MKAWVLYGINDLYLEDVPKPKPKNSEVIVQIKTVGICSSDIARVYEAGVYHYPIILGHEFSGITENGKRVGVFPLLPCFKCESCKRGVYETCFNYSYFGSRQDGAFAEYVAVPEWNLIELPQTVNFTQAAMLEPTAVALHAVKQLDLSNVNIAAVVGNGVIGKIIVKWLKIYGVANVVLYGRNDMPEKADAYFEVAGNTKSLTQCIENVCPNGQVVIVGNPNPELIFNYKLYWQVLRKQISIRGVWNSRFPSDWQEGLSRINELKLMDLVSHVYPFSDLNKAFEMMRQKKEARLKVIINI